MNACLAEACGVPSHNKLLDSIGFEGTLEALYANVSLNKNPQSFQCELPPSDL
jgi:hypothetical protein